MDIWLGYIGVRLITLVAVLYVGNNSEYVDNVGNINEYYIQHIQLYVMVWMMMDVLLTV